MSGCSEPTRQPDRNLTATLPDTHRREAVPSDRYQNESARPIHRRGPRVKHESHPAKGLSADRALRRTVPGRLRDRRPCRARDVQLRDAFRVARGAARVREARAGWPDGASGESAEPASRSSCPVAVETVSGALSSSRCCKAVPLTLQASVGAVSGSSSSSVAPATSQVTPVMVTVPVFGPAVLDRGVGEQHLVGRRGCRCSPRPARWCRAGRRRPRAPRCGCCPRSRSQSRSVARPYTHRRQSRPRGSRSSPAAGSPDPGRAPGRHRGRRGWPALRPAAAAVATVIRTSAVAEANVQAIERGARHQPGGPHADETLGC